MKFIPFNNQPNVSDSRFQSKSPSTVLDDRGHPHIAWLDSKNGKNEVKYSFWDGLIWSTPDPVSFSEEEITISPNSLTIDPNNQSHVVFSNKIANGSLLQLGSLVNGEWDLSGLNVSYDTQWIGVYSYSFLSEFSSSSSSSGSSSSSEENSESSSSNEYSESSSKDSSSSSSVEDSTSSSQSLSSFTSSSSTSSDESESNSSSEGYSESSSSSQSISSSESSLNLSESSSESSDGNSESSSNDSSSSSSGSSSSSENDEQLYVVTIDEVNVLRIYGGSDWSQLGSATLNTFNYFFAGISGRYIVAGYLRNGDVKYNFFDINELVWENGGVQDFTGNTNDILVVGGNGKLSPEDDPTLLISWVEEIGSSVYVKYGNVNLYGLESVSILETNEAEATSATYLANGYSVLGIDRVSEAVLASGARTKIFSNGSSDIVEVLGPSGGLAPNSLFIEHDGTDYVTTFENDNSDIYSFKSNSDQINFAISPTVAIYNNERMLISQYKDGALNSGFEAICTYDNMHGALLRAAKNPVSITMNDGDDDECNSSSSSSSNDSSSSSSSSSSSVDSSSSSSSSEGYSDSSSTSECNWVAKGTNANYVSLGMSGDGKYQTAGTVSSRTIYKSSDYGHNWASNSVAIASTTGAYGFGISTTGQFQAYADGGSSPIKYSNTYGVTWTDTNSINGSWRDVSISGLGTRVTGVRYSNQIYVCADIAIDTWTAVGPSVSWTSVAMSDSGEYQTAVASATDIQVSNDYGVTFNAKGTALFWTAVAMSSSGEYQTATENNGNIWVSSDFGETWVAKATARQWKGVDMSASGEIQLAVVSFGTNQIFKSIDFGETWVAEGPSKTWDDVQISDDGTYKSASGNFTDGIYIEVCG